MLNDYRVLDEGVLLALDGLWYFSSETIHCSHCLSKQVHDKKSGEVRTVYYHAAVAGAPVKPGCKKVLPVAAEIISNRDGAKKQDCEKVVEKGWSFIFNCKPDSHPWLMETVKTPMCMS